MGTVMAVRYRYWWAWGTTACTATSLLPTPPPLSPHLYLSSLPFLSLSLIITLIYLSISFSLSISYSWRLSPTFTFIQLKARRRNSRKTWFHREWPTETAEARWKAALIKSCDFDQLYSPPLLSLSHFSSRGNDQFNFLLFLINSRDQATLRRSRITLRNCPLQQVRREVFFANPSFHDAVLYSLTSTRARRTCARVRRNSVCSAARLR